MNGAVNAVSVFSRAEEVVGVAGPLLRRVRCLDRRKKEAAEERHELSVRSDGGDAASISLGGRFLRRSLIAGPSSDSFCFASTTVHDASSTTTQASAPPKFQGRLSLPGVVDALSVESRYRDQHPATALAHASALNGGAPPRGHSVAIAGRQQAGSLEVPARSLRALLAPVFAPPRQIKNPAQRSQRRHRINRMTSASVGHR